MDGETGAAWAAACWLAAEGLDASRAAEGVVGVPTSLALELGYGWDALSSGDVDPRDVAEAAAYREAAARGHAGEGPLRTLDALDAAMDAGLEFRWVEDAG